MVDTRLPSSRAEIAQPTKAQVVRDLTRWPSHPVCADAHVEDVASGYFTQKQVKVTVYIVQDCINQTRPAGGLNSQYWRMAVYQGTRLKPVYTCTGTAIGNIGDINGDGLADLVFLGDRKPLNGEDTAQRQGATFFTLAGGQFRRLFDLNEALAMDCSSGPNSY